jgi:hypothetical protein
MVYKAYILKLEGADTLNGWSRAVRWVNGQGVLDRIGFATIRPDLCDMESLNFKESGEEIFYQVLKFWKDRGAKVQEVSEEEGKAYQSKLDKDPTGHLPKPVAKTKAKRKAKATPKEDAKAPPHKAKE